MTVCNIYHDGDYLGTAKDYRTAVQFLVGQGYICDNDEVAPFIGRGNSHFEYQRIDELFGEEWADIMAEKWDANEFNHFWDYWYMIEEVEVFGT